MHSDAFKLPFKCFPSQDRVMPNSTHGINIKLTPKTESFVISIPLLFGCIQNDQRVSDKSYLHFKNGIKNDYFLKYVYRATKKKTCIY